MEDVLTENPPPSRFFADDLDNFAGRTAPLPVPFLVKNPNPSSPQNPNPSLIVILISPNYVSLIPKTLTLAAALFLPEISLTHSSPVNVYSVGGGGEALVAAVGCHVSAERAKAVAKLLLNEFKADRVVVFDSLKAENFRGRLIGDEAALFKLETREERRSPEGGLVKGVEWLGSGSLVDGLAAAVMGECEMRRRKGTAVVVAGGGGGGRRAVARVLKDLGVEVEEGGESFKAASSASASSWLDSDLYT